MKLNFYILLYSSIFLIGCSDSLKNTESQKWKAEIIQVEKAFNDMAQKEGLVKAFEFYAAEDGVIKRQNQIFKGKEAIREWYERDVRPNESLTWEPTFVDVSISGDLAYTYGNYVFSYPDSLGNMQQNKGVFHTVWKRQSDGSWKYVWD